MDEKERERERERERDYEDLCRRAMKLCGADSGLLNIRGQKLFSIYL